MLFDLTISRLAGINCSLDRLSLGIDVCLNVDLFALVAVLDIEELQATTRALCHSAERPASLTRTYGVANSRLPVGYWLRPCR